MIPINYWAVLACVAEAVVLGALWYGPLFGKQWMKVMGWTTETMAAMRSEPKMKSAMMRSYVIQIIGSILMAFVLAHAVVLMMMYRQIPGLSAGLAAGFMMWLGFVAPVTIGGVLWEQKPWKWWFLLAGYNLVNLLLMGVILGSWM